MNSKILKVLIAVIFSALLQSCSPENTETSSGNTKVEEKPARELQHSPLGEEADAVEELKMRLPESMPVEKSMPAEKAKKEADDSLNEEDDMERMD